MPFGQELCFLGMDVELRHLKALVVIAEEGTITAAAARLRLTQPALSRTLAALEGHLDVRLVDRSSRHLTLTPAGRTLREHGQAILAHVDAALAETTAVSRPLRVGYTCAVLGELTVPLLRSWRRSHPHVTLELRRVDSRTAGLATGETDVAVLRTRPADARLRAEALYLEERVAALPDDHALAARPALTLAELADESLVACPEAGAASVELWPRERRPESVRVVDNVDAWLTTIAAGDAVGIAAAGTRESHQHPGVAYVPVTDAPAATVYVAHPAQPTHPQTTEFLAVVREAVSG
ncbi:LysR family transcriptional regulator [Streptomyces sp. NPDC056149]|uniref:LysR family transcriptional regulator n=1 Tax=Streptomyces sp. NPDC056149 TaxID=3345728 RepID=UPI0035E015BD